MDANLKAMKKQWEKLGIESFFPRVHHFCRSRKPRNEPLGSFCKHCEGKSVGRSNLQTLARAEEVAKLRENGVEINAAIAEAWRKWPL